MIKDERLKRFRADLYAALDAAGVAHDRDVFRGGLEIGWRFPYPETEGFPATKVRKLPGIAVASVRVRWLEMISVVFWPDVDVERLLGLSFNPRRAVDVVLSRRTQWEVETFCAALERIERQLTGGDTDNEDESNDE